MDQQITNKIEIIFENEDLWVINKPKGLIVHHTAYQKSNTLADWVKKHIHLNDFVDQERIGIVHRLDQYTNGLMIVAKNQKSLENLQKQIVDGILIRKYQAIVHNPFENKKIIIKAPLMRSKQNQLKFIVSDNPKAKDAITHIEVLKNFKKAAYIECLLETGRTHQIRVHMQYIHHYIFNDPVYGVENEDSNYNQYLFSSYLKFVDPSSNKVMVFSLEPDSTFKKMLERLDNE